MTCTPFRLADGTFGIACTRGERPRRCSACKSRPATLLCDYPLRGSKAGKTCDKPLCERCAAHVGTDRDLCPAHAGLEAK
jgi:hypothetical protein